MGEGEVGTFADNKMSLKSCNSQNYIVLTKKIAITLKIVLLQPFFLTYHSVTILTYIKVLVGG